MERVFMDTESSVDIMIIHYFRKMRSTVKVESVVTSLFGFTGEAVWVVEKVDM